MITVPESSVIVRSRLTRRTVVICFCFCAFLVQSTAAALPDRTIADYAAFPTCDQTTTIDCVEEFLISTDPTFSDFAAPPSGVYLDAHYYSGSLSVQVLGPSYQELSDVLPVGSRARISLNVGGTVIGPQIESKSIIKSTSRSDDTEQGNVFTVEIEATEFTSSICSSGDPTVTCPEASWTSKLDYQSMISAIVTAYQGSTQKQAWSSQLAGLTKSDNATLGSSAVFNWRTQTITFDGQTTPTKADNVTLNSGRIELFIPDSALVSAFAVNPDSMVVNGKAKMLKVSTTEGAAPDLLVTRESDGVLFAFSNFTFDRHVFKIKPKKLLPRPEQVEGRGGSAKATISIAEVQGAARYQALCMKATVLKQAIGKRGKQSVVVKGLTTGTWSCRGRGVGVNGGYWSEPISVRVK